MRRSVLGSAGSLFLLASSGFAAEPALSEEILNKVPLRFEAVSDQAWIARGLGFAISLQDRGTLIPAGDRLLQLTFPGSNPEANFEGLSKAPNPTHHFSGRGYQGTDAYLSLRRAGIYPGIDVRYYGQGSSIEYDFELGAGADPSPIRMRFDGADSVRLNSNGELIITINGQEITQKAPAVYQRTAAGGIVSVRSAYFPESDGAYSIQLGSYDAAEPVVIDPQLLFTAYLAGTGAEAPLALARDNAGSIYIAGYTHSTDFPGVGPTFPVKKFNANRHIFVTKLNPFATGANVIPYSGLFGGEFGDLLRAMTVENGAFYLTGLTDDFFFPDTPNAYRTDNGQTRRMFFSVLDTNLPGEEGLKYSTFFGGNGLDAETDITSGDGSGNDEPTAIAVFQGRAYITGYARTDFYPVKAPLQDKRKGGIDAFIAEFDPTKSGQDSLVHSTYLGGVLQEVPRSIAVDAQGKVYVGGYTYSPDFPTTVGSYKPFYSGGGDVFVAKVNLNAPAIEYATYVGTTGLDQGWKVLVDPRNGLISLTGFTLSNAWPVTPDALQSTAAGNGDAFLTIIDPNTTDFTRALIYSTYFGGSDGEVVYDMRQGPTGAYYLAGYTLSRDLPVRDALRPASSGASTDGFVAIIDPTAAPQEALRYSSYVTGGGFQIADAIEVDAAGNVYVTGEVFGNVFDPGQASAPELSNTNVFFFVFRPSNVIRQDAPMPREGRRH